MITLKPGLQYTLVKYGEIGFVFAVKMTLAEIRVESYAQYPETTMLVFKQKGKRKLRGLRLMPRDRFIIWEGWVDPNVDIYARTVDTSFGPNTGFESFLSFSEEYMTRALASVPAPPLYNEGEIVLDVRS